jgi:hypothetical protein
MSERPNTTGSNPKHLSIKDVRTYNESCLLSTKKFFPSLSLSNIEAIPYNAYFMGFFIRSYDLKCSPVRS